MNTNVNSKANGLKKALNLLNSKHKKNYKQKIHDEVRDFFIENLESIKQGLTFVDKELRIIGGTIDIVAKDEKAFYLIEIKTESYGSSAGIKWSKIQLLSQKKGLQHILSVFMKKRINIELLLIRYNRYSKRVRICSIKDSGEIGDKMEFFLTGD